MCALDFYVEKTTQQQLYTCICTAAGEVHERARQLKNQRGDVSNIDHFGKAVRSCPIQRSQRVFSDAFVHVLPPCFLPLHTKKYSQPFEGVKGVRGMGKQT